VNYPFKLFNDLQTQDFTLEVAIIPQQTTPEKIINLSRQLVVKIQGNTTEITPYSPLIVTDNQAFYVQQKITYQQFLDNLAGFNVILSNQTDHLFVGGLKVTLFMDLNGNQKETILLEQSLNVLPVLKLCSQDKSGNIIAGNTILKQAQSPDFSGMQITKSFWTNPYNFTLFDSPIIQIFELEATVQINQPPAITENIINQITVRFQDENSNYHLLTPDRLIQGNK
ncbi:MAG: phage tail protein, partial [Dolichospermum sp.]